MKRYTLFTLLLIAVNTLAGTTFEFQSADDLSQTEDGFTVVLAKGNGTESPKYNVSWNTDYMPSDMRLYTGNTITVSGEGLTNIQMVFAKTAPNNKQYTGLSASVGDLVSGGEASSNTDWKIDVWTGEASQVVFTLTGKGQRQITKLVINGEPIQLEEPEEPAPLPTEDDLQTDYSYSEPTLVSVPDTTIVKTEYAFIDQNVLVHCTQGSIVKATDTTEAYFNCNAGFQMSFTATKPIMGLEVNGYVRKAFSATCDNGKISYLTNDDYELEGDPVLVIRNINSTSVTLTCPKQIRCYAVRIYFESNPDPLGTETAINETEHSQTQVQKILRNGQTLIITDNNTFTITGEQL